MDPRVIGGVRVARAVSDIDKSRSRLEKKYRADDKKADRSVPARHRADIGRNSGLRRHQDVGHEFRGN